MRTLKLRIYPNKAQQEQINKTIGCCRFVYNHSLEKRIKFYQENQKVLSKYELINNIVSLKKTTEFSWLKEVNSQSLQQAVFRLDKAFVAFFKKNNGFPKFKSKKSKVQSFDVPQHFQFSPLEKTVKIPKIGVLRFRDKLNFRKYGEARTVQIVKDGDKFYACVVCESDNLDATEEISFDKALGVDLGVKTFATLSNGLKIDLVKLSKHVSKAARQRKDFLHKLSTQIVDNQNYSTIVVEDMDVKSMMKSGIKNVNRAIGSQGWGMFIEMLNYKCKERGKNLVLISPFECASRTCTCGRKKSDLKLTDRKWTCSCGLTHDRDLLAANNIRKFGTGDSTVVLGHST